MACPSRAHHSSHAGATGTVGNEFRTDATVNVKEPTMSSIKSTLKAAALVVALSPAAAFAGSFWHTTTGEPGAVMVPEHWKGRSAAEARAELDAARADGSLAIYQRGFPVAPKGYKPTPKTRAEVIREIGPLTPAQREIYVGA
jgi:hypothetical protein